LDFFDLFKIWRQKRAKNILFIKTSKPEKTKEKENAQNFKYSNQKLFGTIQGKSNRLV